MSINSRRLINALRQGGYRSTSFPAPELDGSLCVAVVLRNERDIMSLQSATEEVVHELDLGDPQTVRTREGLIAYWTEAELTEAI